jgi:hypothetical protein
MTIMKGSRAAADACNSLVHGQQVFKAKNCDVYTKHVLAALKKLHHEIRSDYGSDPWTVLRARRRSKLQWLEPIRFIAATCTARPVQRTRGSRQGYRI